MENRAVLSTSARRKRGEALTFWARASQWPELGAACDASSYEPTLVFSDTVPSSSYNWVDTPLEPHLLPRLIMNKLQQIDSFSTFAKSRLRVNDSTSIDDLYFSWRSESLRDIGAAAVLASVADLKSGETGQDLGEFLSDFDRNRETL